MLRHPATALDIGALDIGALDIGAADIGALDTGALDTGALDTGALDTGAPAAAAPPRRRARRGPATAAPLGSLTQLRATHGCAGCGSSRVTHLAMRLTDGTPVVFTSCHRCEERRWDHEGETLSVTDVIERTRKPA